MVIIKFMPVQAETGFQTQGVTRSQTNRQYAEFLACLKNSIPQFVGIRIVSIHFTTARTGVTGSGEYHFVYACKRYFLESIILHINDIFIRQFLHGFQGKRTLDGKLANVVGGIFHIHAGFHAQLFPMLHYPVPIFLDIGSIHNQQIFLRSETVNQ